MTTSDLSLPRARRIEHNPIITPKTPGATEAMGTNINGPSLIRVPEFVTNPLGRYYLYFAHHQGKYIRLAYADAPTGPYRIHAPGVLPIADTPFQGHIASPDVHIDQQAGELIMYYHGCPKVDPNQPWEQSTMRATSGDGLQWTSEQTELGESYFRVFRWQDMWYVVGKGGRLYRSDNGIDGFELRPGRIDDGIPGHGRHWAVHRTGETLHVIFSRWFDEPEHLLYAMIDLSTDWQSWRLTKPVSLLKPKYEWEGSHLPIQRSQNGAVHKPVHELRDPAIYAEGVDLYLVYSVAGESGLAMAMLDLPGL